MKKSTLIMLLAIVTAFLAGNFYGSRTWYLAADCTKNADGNITESIMYPHSYSTSEALKAEREYCEAWMELCHYYLYDNNPHYCEECLGEMPKAERHNYWLDVVSESAFYDKIDSLNQGDWEDWYCDWY